MSEVIVLKVKKDIPTVISYAGHTYILRPEGLYQGGANRGKRSSK